MPRRRSDPGFGSGPPRYPGTFLLAFREALASLNWQVRRWLGDAVECLDAGGHEQIVGLENLYRRARRAERTEWPALITQFLTDAGGSDIAGELPTELDPVADQLLVRLGQPFQVRGGEERVWSQSLAGTDLVMNLVIDFPSRMVYVTEKLMDDSDRPASEWLERALTNLRENTPEDCFEEVDEESGLLWCKVEDAYDSSRALLLAELLGEFKEDGYFVGLPSRDVLYVLPVNRDALGFLYIMKATVEKEHRSRPYPISSEVFWVRDGKWHRFGVDIDLQSKRMSLTPPPEFVEVLERLMPEGADVEEEPPEGENEE